MKFSCSALNIFYKSSEPRNDPNHAWSLSQYYYLFDPHWVPSIQIHCSQRMIFKIPLRFHLVWRCSVTHTLRSIRQEVSYFFNLNFLIFYGFTLFFCFDFFFDDIACALHWRVTSKASSVPLQLKRGRRTTLWCDNTFFNMLR